MVAEPNFSIYYGKPFSSIDLSRQGIMVEQLRFFQKYANISNKELATILPISERQLARYAPDHLLRKDISSHIILLIQLFKNGEDVLGYKNFIEWIRVPNYALNDRSPLHYMDTAIGINLISDIIGRIQHGVYS